MSSKLRPSIQPAKPQDPNIFPTFAMTTRHTPLSPQMPSQKTAMVYNPKTSTQRTKQTTQW